MSLDRFSALVQDDSFLLSVYAVVNVCELAITLLLFYIARESGQVEAEVSQREFHLNNFIISDRIIEQLHHARIAITPEFFESAYKSLHAVFGTRPHNRDYASYRAFVESTFGDVDDEKNMNRLLAFNDKKRLRLEYAEVGAFVLLTIFQIFSIWYILQP